MAKGYFCSVTSQTRARDQHYQSPLLYSIRRFIHLAHLTSLQVMRYCTVRYIGGQRLCPNQKQWKLRIEHWSFVLKVMRGWWSFKLVRIRTQLLTATVQPRSPCNALYHIVWGGFSYIQHLQLCPCIDRVFNCWSTDKMLVGWGDSSEHRTLEGGFTFIHTCFYSLALWVVLLYVEGRPSERV